MTEVKIYMEEIEDDKIPFYATPGAAGMDIRSTEVVIIPPRGTGLVPTGIYVKIPEGYEIQVRPRSGLSFKTKLRVANSPGTIDSDYTGEIKVIMDNIGDTHEMIDIGDRVAQLVLCPVAKCEWDLVFNVEDLGNTERGNGGFGSTGKQ